jgi:hypothetical protein
MTFDEIEATLPLGPARARPPASVSKRTCVSAVVRGREGVSSADAAAASDRRGADQRAWDRRYEE